MAWPTQRQRKRHLEHSIKEQSQTLMAIETLITFLTIDNNNHNIHCNPRMKIDWGQNSQLLQCLIHTAYILLPLIHIGLISNKHCHKDLIQIHCIYNLQWTWCCVAKEKGRVCGLGWVGVGGTLADCTDCTIPLTRGPLPACLQTFDPFSFQSTTKEILKRRKSLQCIGQLVLRKFKWYPLGSTTAPPSGRCSLV